MDQLSAHFEQNPWLFVAVSLAVLALVGLVLWALRRRQRPPLLLDEDVDLDVGASRPKVPVVVGGEERPAVGPSSSVARQEPVPAGGLFERLASGLRRTRAAISGQLEGIFARERVDQALFDELEEVLILADVGVTVASRIVLAVKEKVRTKRITDPRQIRGILRQELLEILGRHEPALASAPDEGPLVILVVGVNGGGKTTTIGKLAACYGWAGKKVLLGAGDTYRAGAIEQLRIWADRTGADIVAHDEGADPAAVLFDTLKAAKARGHDVVICDTAGRLQSRKPLMDQLGKVTRVIGKAVAGAPHEVLLVLDATIGQNALSQARVFGEVVGVTGIVLTKLDGTAKGGVVVAVCAETGLPVKFIGVGEKVDDLRPFDAEQFINALLMGPEAPSAAAQPDEPA